jgi:hypothetical protein
VFFLKNKRSPAVSVQSDERNFLQISPIPENPRSEDVEVAQMVFVRFPNTERFIFSSVSYFNKLENFLFFFNRRSASFKSSNSF